MSFGTIPLSLDDKPDGFVLLSMYEKLESENAKLRELLVDVSEEVPWSFMDTTKYCMPLRADKLRKLLCRMRELGVEVDGWAK